jgi:2-C-methyl-D-erythritol 4-phosphate cytidylyltransferase
VAPTGSKGGGSREVGVVIPAAGAGVRFGGPKPFLLLGGQPLLFHSLRAFAEVAEVLEAVVVVRPEELGKTREWVARFQEEHGGVKAGAGGRGEICRLSVTAGGARRQDSVERGLEALSPESRWVLVHDAARPLVRTADIEKVIAGMRESGAAALGHPASDSVKEARDGLVARDLPRAQVWLVQTPQGGSREILLRAFREAKRAGREATDEAGLLTAIGAPVRLVEGSRSNLKVTFPEDLALAELILSSPALRSG